MYVCVHVYKYVYIYVCVCARVRPEVDVVCLLQTLPYFFETEYLAEPRAVSEPQSTVPPSLPRAGIAAAGERAKEKNL